MVAIDISRYQGAPDFAQVKASGVSLVIAKQGGADGGFYTDRQWASNLAGIRDAGLALGSYFFNGPGASPVAAADYQWAAIDYRPGDLVVIDVEGTGIVWSPAQVLTWCERMLAHGVRAVDLGMYISASPLRSQDWSAVAALGGFLWVASYGSNSGSPGTPPVVKWWSSWSLWQYTSNGFVSGIAGRVDMSQIASGFPPARPKKETPEMTTIIKPTTSWVGAPKAHFRTNFVFAELVTDPNQLTLDDYALSASNPPPVQVYDQAHWNLVAALPPYPTAVPLTDAQIVALAELIAGKLNIPTAAENAAAARDAIVAPA